MFSVQRLAGRFEIRLTALMGAILLDRVQELAEKAVKQPLNTAFVQFSYGIIMSIVAQNSIFLNALGYVKKSLSGHAQAVALEPNNIPYRQSLLGYHLNAPGIAGGDKDIALAKGE